MENANQTAEVYSIIIPLTIGGRVEHFNNTSDDALLSTLTALLVLDTGRIKSPGNAHIRPVHCSLEHVGGSGGN